MKPIDYQQIVDNAKQILNAIEYDCMRSGGKTKFNAATLNELYTLVDRLENRLTPIRKVVVKNSKRGEVIDGY